MNKIITKLSILSLLAMSGASSLNAMSIRVLSDIKNQYKKEYQEFTKEYPAKVNATPRSDGAVWPGTKSEEIEFIENVVGRRFAENYHYRDMGFAFYKSPEHSKMVEDLEKTGQYDLESSEKPGKPYIKKYWGGRFVSIQEGVLGNAAGFALQRWGSNNQKKNIIEILEAEEAREKATKQRPEVIARIESQIKRLRDEMEQAPRARL